MGQVRGSVDDLQPESQLGTGRANDLTRCERVCVARTFRGRKPARQVKEVFKEKEPLRRKTSLSQTWLKPNRTPLRMKRRKCMSTNRIARTVVLLILLPVT